MAYQRYSPWQDAGAFANGLGNSLSQLLLQVPQLQMQQERLAQSRAMVPFEIDSLKADIGQKRAHEGLYNDQAAQERTETENLRSVQSLATQAGDQARMREPIALGAPTIENQRALVGAQLLGSLIEAAVRQGNAHQLLSPHNVGPGQTAFDATGRQVGSVAPAPINVPFGSGAYNPTTGANIVPPHFTLGPGAAAFGGEGGTPIASNPMASRGGTLPAEWLGQLNNTILDMQDQGMTNSPSFGESLATRSALIQQLPRLLGLTNAPQAAPQAPATNRFQILRLQ